MTKHYRASDELAEKLDSVLSVDYNNWNEQVREQLKQFNANGFLRGFGGDVVAVSFGWNCMPAEDFKLYKHPPVVRNGIRYFVPRKSSVRHKQLLSMRFNTDDELLKTVGIRRRFVGLKCPVSVKRYGYVWIITCEDESIVPRNCNPVNRHFLDRLSEAIADSEVAS